MSKNDLRVIKTKDALHRTLLEILNEKSLDEITVTEICKRARINRGTFYLHYRQVEDVFGEYFKEITLDLAESYKEPYRKVSVLRASELDPSTVRIFHHIENFKMFYEIILSEKVPLSYYYLLFEEIEKLFQQDMEIKLEEEINHQMYASYHANAIIGMIIYWYKNGFSYSADYMNEQLVQFVNMKTK
ncbi:TetR/AcrR family transcriptional regulator [Salinicoccus kekensis]|uniref:TetR family transcriptional regulator n=1 Tax=Salinicoccus kekensis TaxID=714307 RepID=A0A285UIT3_9STAP|nr:TetR/AcrR family transcriptional regulator [Salinicoccus kekensis]SOC41607.1 TetR family transcriptional regulator [Salinicoccus kekensis]